MKYLFESEHLRFRRFEIKDAQCLYHNHLEEEMKKWIPNESYADISETENAIEIYMDCVNKNKLPFVLAIELKESGELIGDVSVNEDESNSKEVEIGYSISRKHSGNGFATETVNEMIKYIVDKFGIKVLYGRVIKGNNASIKVMEKNGFKYLKKEISAEEDPYGKGMLVYHKR